MLLQLCARFVSSWTLLRKSFGFCSFDYVSPPAQLGLALVWVTKQPAFGCRIFNPDRLDSGWNI